MSRLGEYFADLPDTEATARLRNAAQVLLAAANASLALEEYRLDHGKRMWVNAAPPVLTRLSGFMSDFYLDFDERDNLAVFNTIRQTMVNADVGSRKQAGSMVCNLISEMLGASGEQAEAYRFLFVKSDAGMVRHDFLVWKVGGRKDVLFESMRNFVAVSWARSLVDASGLAVPGLAAWRVPVQTTRQQERRPLFPGSGPGNGAM